MSDMTTPVPANQIDPASSTPTVTGETVTTTEPHAIVEGPGPVGPHEADKPVETGMVGSVATPQNLTPEKVAMAPSIAESGPAGPNVVSPSITGLSLPSPNTTVADPAAAFMPEVLTPVAGPSVAPGNPVVAGDMTSLPAGTFLHEGKLVEPDYTDHKVAEAYQGAVQWTSPAGVEYRVNPETGLVTGKIELDDSREVGPEDGQR